MSRTLLIVEDEIELCELISMQFDLPDVKIIECHSSEEAYDWLTKENVDLVVTDLTMPVMNGLELIDKCHRELSYKPTFYLMTVYAGYDEADLKTKGVQRFFQKPDDMSVLIEESTKFLTTP
ncbi:MAG: response regulator [Bdellovibrionales bacterium]|nr:response regulator [Bdellovibrionales bacterium]NQZ20185.1 response regulator [Bdellovibrionales bacterium]